MGCQNKLSCCIVYCIALFVFLSFAGGTSSAASISGTVSYGGSQTGTIFVAVFTLPITCAGPNISDPFEAVELTSPSNFNIQDLPDGTYYLASVMTMNGPDDEIQATDPWAVFNGCGNITPVVISGEVSAAGKNLILADGTNEIPNPFYIEEKAYQLIVSGEATGSIEFVKTINELWYTGFSVTVNGSDRNAGVYAIIPFATHSPVLAYLPPIVGQSWTDSGDSNGYLTNSIATVKSVSETITTPAGTFFNCAYVEEILSYPDGYTPGQPPPPTKYERWFCPGVGPAKVVITDSSIHTGELVSYQNVIADNSDYFPLGPQFTWVFSMDGLQTTWTVAGLQECSENDAPNLDKAILALRVLAGLPVSQSGVLCDVNDDGHIGMEEALYDLKGYAETSVGTVTSLTGKIWMDRNLGASRVALSFTDSEAFGDLYQWGRGTDGHEKRTSPTTSTMSTTDVPGHGSFIIIASVYSVPYDWRTPQNDNLWQGASGTNNPCPSGFRLPTDTEFSTERASWSSGNSAGAFVSPLKLVMAGSRNYSSGNLTYVGSIGGYWTSTVDRTRVKSIGLAITGADLYSADRTFGISVRCIKD